MMKLIYQIVFLCSLFVVAMQAQTEMRLSPLTHSVGVAVVDLPSDWESDSTLAASMYVRMGDGVWREAISPQVVVIRGRIQIRSVILDLVPNTDVGVRVTVYRGGGVAQEFEGTTRTIAETVPPSSGTLLYVSPYGSGTTYSRSKPGSLRALITAGLPCGSIVVLLEGTYEDIYDLTLNITDDCTAESPIVIMADPSRTVVITGETFLNTSWEVTPTDAHEWSCPLPTNLKYTSLVVGQNGQRLYPYALRAPVDLFPGYPSLLDLGYDQPGMFRSGARLYLRDTTSEAKPPGLVRTSQRWSCLTVNGNYKQSHLLIRGITFRYFGNTRCTENILGIPDACYPPSTLSFNNTRNVTVANCEFEFANFPITFNGSCSDIDVRFNTISDGVGTWSHGAFKQTRDTWILEPGSYGRYLENVGIWIAPFENDSVHNINIRGNTVVGTIAGIAVGSNAHNYVVDNVDILNNTVSSCYDGIDITGGNGSGSTNARIRNNVVSNTPVGTSLMYPSFGPYFITRNVYLLADRKNHNNDVFFVTCNNDLTDRSWTTALKLNAGGENSTPGAIQFHHNTVVGRGLAGFGLYFWGPTWSEFSAFNNIIQADASSWMFDGVAQSATYSTRTDGNIYHSPSTGAVATIKPVHGISQCYEPRSVDEFRADLSLVTGSPFVVIGQWDKAANPLLADVPNGSVQLQAGSPAIDKGLLLPGINDLFYGSAPDVGALESSFSSSVEAVDVVESPLHAPGPTRYYSLTGVQVDPSDLPTGLYFKILSDSRGSVKASSVIIVR
ncbi:MAG: hypothetical protein KA339_01875 [Candidatus Kapabacteria bacterium]|nr:hypothetical protein [Candidatus Kapabacteria bacterium]